MAETLKVLGQVLPSANTDTTLYTVPGATQAAVSTIVICNQATSSATYRLATRVAGAALEGKQYQCYDTVIAANDSIALTLGITLGAADVLTVRSSSATVSFTAYGSEVA